jgi:hypothetical protein
LGVGCSRRGFGLGVVRRLLELVGPCAPADEHDHERKRGDKEKPARGNGSKRRVHANRAPAGRARQDRQTAGRWQGDIDARRGFR